MSKISTKSLLSDQGVLVKSVSVFYLLTLFIATVTMIKSYSYGPFVQTNIDLQNLGRGLSIGAIGILILLSSLQKNVYWDFRKRKENLDEREIALRRKIFETSYKLGVVIVAIAAYLLISNRAWIIRNAQLPFGDDMFWAPFNLVVLLIALPPIVASWQAKWRAPKDISETHIDNKTSKKRTKPSISSWIIGLWVGLWVYFLVSISIVNILPENNYWFQFTGIAFGLAGLLTLPSIVLLIIRFMKKS